MNVLVVNPSLFAPYYDYHLCKALADHGDTVTLVGRPLRKHEKLGPGSFSFADVFYRRAPQRDSTGRASRLSYIAKGLEHGVGLRALVSLANTRHADIVHFQWLVVPWLDRIALRRLRSRCGLVLTVHNSEISTHSRTAVVGQLGSAIQSIGQRGAVMGFDRYIVHSDKALQGLARLGIHESRITLRQHPPLELNVDSTPTAEAPKTVREILFFGAIKPYKGVDVLVEAGLILAAKRRDFRITIAGQPFMDLSSLRSKVAASGMDELFRFDLDFVSEAALAKYLSGASIVVFPYREIDGSGALSHAVRFGTPIVASRVGGFAEPPFSEFLEHVPPGDIEGLASTLSGLLDDPGRLAELGRRSAALRSALPTWQDYAGTCRAIYREICSHGSGRDLQS